MTRLADCVHVSIAVQRRGSGLANDYRLWCCGLHNKCGRGGCDRISSPRLVEAAVFVSCEHCGILCASVVLSGCRVVVGVAVHGHGGRMDIESVVVHWHCVSVCMCVCVCMEVSTAPPECGCGVNNTAALPGWCPGVSVSGCGPCSWAKACCGKGLGRTLGRCWLLRVL